MTRDDQLAILQAIRQDQPADFDRLTGKHKNLRFGRFSLLSICYLFGAHRIVRAHKNAMRQGAPVDLDELPAVYNAFVAVAGRSLRLWAGYVRHEVHPLAVLALTGDWRTLRREYPTYVCTPDEQTRLVEAIYLRYHVRARVEEGKLILPPKPLSVGTRSLLWSAAAALTVVMLASIALLGVGAGYKRGVGVRSAESLAEGKAGVHYGLQADVTLDAPTEWAAFSLDGDDHFITVEVGEEPILADFAGTVENCTIVFKCASMALRRSYACLGLANHGTWRNVRFVFEGDEGWCFTLVDFVKAQDGNQTCMFGGLFVTNAGTIEGCTLEGDLSWVGMAEVDGEAGAYCGSNEGIISSCTLEGSVRADTVDVGGLVFRNEKSGVIEGCTLSEGVEVSQTTAVYKWSPMVGGVAAFNYGTIADTQQLGGVTAKKENVVFPENIDATYVYVGGLAAHNFGTVSHCLSKGAVTGSADYAVIYAGGIVSDNNYSNEDDALHGALNGNITVSTVSGVGYYVYVGGIAGASAGKLIDNCFNGGFGSDTFRSNATYVGSMAGFGTYEDGDVPDFVQNNHVIQLQLNSIFGVTPLPVVGYMDQVHSGVSSMTGVTAHVSTADFADMEVYWYGK